MFFAVSLFLSSSYLFLHTGQNRVTESSHYIITTEPLPPSSQVSSIGSISILSIVDFAFARCLLASIGIPSNPGPSIHTFIVRVSPL